MMEMEKILCVPALMFALVFSVGGIIYAYAEQMRLGRRAEILAGLAFVGGGVAMLVISVVMVVLRLVFGLK